MHSFRMEVSRKLRYTIVENFEAFFIHENRPRPAFSKHCRQFNLEKQNELTEDDRKQSLDEIQKITNEIISKMDNLLTSKEKEIMEV